MKKELTAKIITKMKRETVQWRFLVTHKLTKESVSQALSQKQFYETMLDHISQDDYTCKGMVDSYRPVAKQLFDVTIADDFFSQVYQYALSKSFPEATTSAYGGYKTPVFECYLILLEVLNTFQNQSEDGSFMSIYPLKLLSESEIRRLDQPEEYKRFKEAFEQQHIYAMMKLNYEITGHSTIEHILGVHHLAMYIGRQMVEAGFPVDLGRVSGAAAGHDIGKFGCRPEESSKIAYYHYYYTYHWFSQLEINYIKNVAVYHSTWDLEIESLSVESLILIFSDFCVKRSKATPGCFKMKFLDVDAAFQVILNKLDNVDNKKRRRYERVYQKLRNFAEFLSEQGIHTIIDNYVGEDLMPLPGYKPRNVIQSSLDTGQKVIDHLKSISINRSIHLMHRLRHVDALNEIIQEALSEKDIHLFRRYIYIFEEYSIYLTPNQKMITMQFLMGYIMHMEEDIRKECSGLIGKLLAYYDENYAKELPERAQVTYTVETKYNKLKEMLDQFFFNETRLTAVKRQRQVTSYLYIIRSLYAHVDIDFQEMVTNLLTQYFDEHLDQYGKKFMMQVIHEMPFDHLAVSQKEKIIHYLIDHLEGDVELRLLSISQLRDLIRCSSDTWLTETLQGYSSQILDYLHKEKHVAEFYLSKELEEIFHMETHLDTSHSNSDMFLSNLKTATFKTIKTAQIEVLFQNSLEEGVVDKFYTAMHFCNIIKVSAYESVRSLAGEFLIDLFPHLSTAHQNDIVIELIRALEIEGYGFTQYIPRYLGQLIPTLPEKEYDEIVDDLEYKVSNAGSDVRILILDTLGTMISSSPNMPQEHVKKLLGLIFKGFYSDHRLVTQVALNVLSKDILGNDALGLDHRFDIFKAVYRKINNILLDIDTFSGLDLLNDSVGMHYIYRFITDYDFYKGEFDLKDVQDVAIYSGTFDPFSLGQKAAAVDAASLGLDVYINISEFQWRRRTQPSLVRRQIAEMSLADEFGIYTFPQSRPINLQRAEDLDRLKGAFENRKIYIVVGEDALLNEPVYQDVHHPIFQFAHLIYKRESLEYTKYERKLIDTRIAAINGETRIRSLDYEFEMIDTEQIRRNIDNNWDGYHVLDDLASRMIQSKNLYKNEPQFKSTVPISNMSLEKMPLSAYDDLKGLCQRFKMNYEDVSRLIQEEDASSEAALERVLLLIRQEEENELIGCAIYARAMPKHLFDEIKCLDILEDISQKQYTKIQVIDYLKMIPSASFHALDQIVLTETLMQEVTKGTEFAVIKWPHASDISNDIYGVILRSGFIEHTCTYSKRSIFSVDMTAPVVLNLDGTTRMKSDYRQNPVIREDIKMVRSDLQQAIVKLYPGCLVLSFDRSMLYNHLIRKITSRNQVDIHHTGSLGRNMCVPYGDIFKRWLLPNTVTKAFHTERYYTTELTYYDVEAYPGYLSIEDQVSVLRGFDKPVILVDDILDKGNRLIAFEKPLKAKGVVIDQVIVGILSERGKEKFESRALSVDAAYYIPKIKVWFNESDLYPFIGGDSVKREGFVSSYALRSANLMLPFCYPKYIKGVDKSKLYNLSVVCLENAISILETMEACYLELNGRALTLKSLREVMIIPRVPDIGAFIDYDIYQRPSVLLANELERLKKMKMAFMEP